MLHFCADDTCGSVVSVDVANYETSKDRLYGFKPSAVLSMAPESAPKKCFSEECVVLFCSEHTVLLQTMVVTSPSPY